MKDVIQTVRSKKESRPLTAIIPIGLGIHGSVAEKWSDLTMKEVAGIIGFNGPTLIGVIPFAMSLMRKLPAESPTKIRSVAACKGSKLPKDYPKDWAVHTLSDLAKVLGLPQGEWLRELTKHAARVMREIEHPRK